MPKVSVKFMKIFPSSDHKQLINLDHVSRYDILALHNLSKENYMDRYSVCNTLLKQHNTSFKRIIIVDKKWIVGYI